MVETEIAAPPTTDRTVLAPLTQTSGTERMFPTLTPAQIERIAVHGHVRPIRPGEILIEAGEQVVPFFVVTAGRSTLSGHPVPARLSSPSTDRVSSPAKSTCSQTAPRSHECAPASRRSDRVGS